MINYWWASRPKMRLDSVPEVLAVFAEASLNQEWEKQRGNQIAFEDALEEAGLKREGSRRDGRGSGGRTYAAWLKSLGLIFTQESTKRIQLTIAGEAIMKGESPVKVLKNQVLKYQFPSSFSVGQNVEVHKRFKIRPIRFLLRLLSDSRINYLTRNEIARIIIVEAENESNNCYEKIVNRILLYREHGDSILDYNFVEKYDLSGRVDSKDKMFKRLDTIAGTFLCWIEYTQLAVRDYDTKNLEIIPDKLSEVKKILSDNIPFIDRPLEHEYYQRKYGLDPSHSKDMRNLEETVNITETAIMENKIRTMFIKASLKKPFISITSELIDDIARKTNYSIQNVESFLRREYPHGSLNMFLSSYFEMAFKGTEESVEFEEATAQIFSDVFGYKSKHLGQTGRISAPDVLLLSDSEGYQAIIDNKAYRKYSISGDHHNRMVHNYIEKINNYSPYNEPIGYFSYISGGFANNINNQIKSISNESGVHGSGISVSNFIQMIENHTDGTKIYSHKELRDIFGLDREVLLRDIN